MPLIIRAPTSAAPSPPSAASKGPYAAAGEVTQQLAELIDLFPTVAQLAGIPITTAATTATAAIAATAATTTSAGAAAAVTDTFTTYNDAVWSYADASEGTTDGCKVWYSKNHSRVNAVLSDGSSGLSMLMSRSLNPAACKGAKMTADHVEGKQSQLYGTYTLKARAPHKVGSASGACDNGTYAYFTAGYASHGGKWNEMNFGFHPDRDEGGYAVSCEHHDDTGGYHETTVKVGKNVRATFNTFAIKVSERKMEWSFNGKVVHSAEGKWTEPMTTRLIMRTNFRSGDPGVMPDHVFEINEYSFTPAAAATATATASTSSSTLMDALDGVSLAAAFTDPSNPIAVTTVVDKGTYVKKTGKSNREVLVCGAETFHSAVFHTTILTLVLTPPRTAALTPLPQI